MFIAYNENMTCLSYQPSTPLQWHGALLLVNHKHAQLAALPLQQMLWPMRQIRFTAYQFCNLIVDESVSRSGMFLLISLSNILFGNWFCSLCGSPAPCTHTGFTSKHWFCFFLGCRLLLSPVNSFCYRLSLSHYNFREMYLKWLIPSSVIWTTTTTATRWLVITEPLSQQTFWLSWQRAHLIMLVMALFHLGAPVWHGASATEIPGWDEANLVFSFFSC